MSKVLFTPGRVGMTRGVEALLQDGDVTPLDLVKRHLSGDFGIHGRFDEIDVTDEELREGPLATADDGKLNKAAILQDKLGEWQGRIMSAYIVNDEKVWIITEADRSATTLLLPEEY